MLIPACRQKRATVTAENSFYLLLSPADNPICLFYIFIRFNREKKMATLADELAADLDFSSDEEEQQQGSDIDEEQEALNNMIKRDLDGDVLIEETNDEDKPIKENPNGIRKVAKLLNSKQTQEVLQVCIYLLLLYKY